MQARAAAYYMRVCGVGEPPGAEGVGPHLSHLRGFAGLKEAAALEGYLGNFRPGHPVS